MASVYKRGAAYWIRFQHEGQTIRKSARTTRKDVALRVLVETQEQYARWSRSGRRRYTVAEAIERYNREHVPLLKPSTQAGYRNNVRQLWPHFAHLHLDEVNKSRIAEFISARRRGGTSSPTIRRDLAVLSSIFSCALSWDWFDANPIKNFDKRVVRENPPRVRYLTPEEYERLLAAAAPYLRPIIQVALQTGMRAGELLPLQWPQVNLRRREITLTVTKTDMPRVVPLTADAVTTFVSIPRHPVSPYVFHKPTTGEPYKRIIIGFRGAVRRAGIADFRFHDLRHTYASWAVQAGMDLYRLSRILGHSTTEMTSKYAHLSTSDLHQALADLDTLVGTRTTDSAA